MAEDKRNRPDQQPSGNERRDRQRNRDRKPGGTESPGSGRARREDEEQPQE
jgi:hypothetical protein